VDSSFALNDGALGMLLVLACVPFDQGEALDDGALFGGNHLDDLAALAFFGTGDDDHVIPFFNVKFLHN
jgi:hypothetical protein